MKNINEREIAVFAMMDIIGEGGYNNIVLNRALNKLDDVPQASKGMVTELVNGTLRNLLLIDYVIGLHSKTPVKKMKPLIKSILRISVYQIMFMDRVPDSAACNEAVKLAKDKGFTGLSGFVNGVLRACSRGKESIVYPDKEKGLAEYLCVVYSHPKWLVEYWLSFMSGETVERILKADNETPEMNICVNMLKTTPQKLIDLLVEEGAKAEPAQGCTRGLVLKGVSNLRRSKNFNAGLFHVMDTSSMKAMELLNPCAGESVLDLCAAPGGKSFYAAILMGNKGKIAAMDIHEHKLELIENSAKRLGLDIIEAGTNDALRENTKFVESWDRVLLDAPCSGLGTLRKKPDARYKKSMEDVEALVSMQRGMLKAAAKYPRIGGRLMYSTCTISVKENEQNVAWFLENYPYEIEKELSVLPGEGTGDGFFAVCMIRKA